MPFASAVAPAGTVAVWKPTLLVLSGTVPVAGAATPEPPSVAVHVGCRAALDDVGGRAGDRHARTLAVDLERVWTLGRRVARVVGSPSFEPVAIRCRAAASFSAPLHVLDTTIVGEGRIVRRQRRANGSSCWQLVGAGGEVEVVRGRRVVHGCLSAAMSGRPGSWLGIHEGGAGRCGRHPLSRSLGATPYFVNLKSTGCACRPLNL